MKNLNEFAKVSVVAFLTFISLDVTAQEQNTVVPTRRNLRDVDIEHAVKNDLNACVMLPADSIIMSAHDGIVILSGRVPCMFARQQAVEMCSTIKGVRAVVNRLEISSERRDDEEVLHDIQQALLQDPATEKLEITASVNHGSVTLTGKVRSHLERQLALQVIQCIRGIKEIVNEIEYDLAQPPRTDKDLKIDIQQRLTNDPWIDEELIIVRVQDGHVQLLGAVGSLAERNWAETDAWVSGVKSVNTEEMDIRWWARNEMRTQIKTVERTDNEIATAVKHAFRHDIRVNSNDIDISVLDGVVTLSGKTDYLKAKMAAEEDAGNTIGARKVINQIEVIVPEEVQDEDLNQQINAALKRDSVLHQERLSSSCSKGTVVLSGNVDSLMKRYRAEDIVSRIKGVRKTQNTIQVNSGKKTISDDDLQKYVESAIKTNAFITNEVSVSVNDGNVRLVGEVERWHQRVTIEQLTYDRGAKAIDNQLTVKKFSKPEFRRYYFSKPNYGWNY